ncbi:MAG: nitroreductase family protein [Saccharofermentanales bacterium]|jgi:hypothetical protein
MYYEMIFKRKSFHLFENIGNISDEELEELKAFIANVKPLDESIRFVTKIVPESQTSCKRGAQYCIEFYSEEKGNYLRNIGYIGEQIDLWLAERNIGALWFGLGKPKKKKEDNLKFIIMIAFAKMPEESFRQDMFKSKRKQLDEIWEGEKTSISDIIRFAPSACNTQPWLIENEGGYLNVYRYKEPGKRGIMPAKKVSYYNRIDIGIFMFFLETCLTHDRYTFEGTQYYEDEPDSTTKVLVAKYKIYR